MSSAESHLEMHLQRDLDGLQGRLEAMGSMACSAVDRASTALIRRDSVEAQAVILRDHRIDRLRAEIEVAGLEILIRHHPVGRPLRFSYGSMRIAEELERIGDCAESIARQALQLETLDPQPPVPRFDEQIHHALEMLAGARKAYLTVDERLARELIPMENAADQIRDRVRDDLLRQQKEGLLSGAALNLLLTVARRLERVTDHARNICEEVLFVATGQPAQKRHVGPIRVLFVDDTHSGLGHLAEALGRQLAGDRIEFGSAGIDPVPVLTGTRDFLSAKGIDVSRLASRSMGQVPPPEEHHLVVALSPKARRAFPMSGTRTLCLFWPIPDPAAFADPTTALETAWQALDQRLRPLIEAVLRD